MSARRLRTTPSLNLNVPKSGTAKGTAGAPLHCCRRPRVQATPRLENAFISLTRGEPSCPPPSKATLDGAWQGICACRRRKRWAAGVPHEGREGRDPFPSESVRAQLALARSSGASNRPDDGGAILKRYAALRANVAKVSRNSTMFESTLVNVRRPEIGQCLGSRRAPRTVRDAHRSSGVASSRRGAYARPRWRPHQMSVVPANSSGQGSEPMPTKSSASAAARQFTSEGAQVGIDALALRHGPCGAG